MLLFDIKDEKDVEKYTTVIKDFLVYYKQVEMEEAEKLSKLYFNNLLQGLDFNGNDYPTPKITNLPARIQEQTGGYFSPTKTEQKRYKLKDKRKAANTTSVREERKADEEEALKKIKKTLLYEYPFLDKRKDLDTIIDNYCILSLRISQELQYSGEKQSTTIKNLIDAQIRLGTYLGVSEGDRQKTKLTESKDNIASLAVQFEQTLEEFPELMDAFRYNELKMLLNKYERKEISRVLFEGAAFADMSVEDAYLFVGERESKYDRV
ncbi:hypothetical protein M0R04_05860 [Candidatus Dojkabacteria bacterium]|jgi:hypothetical protein|nr:hypothetical protein [Candidatus Dojkabacteria bacterium]